MVEMETFLKHLIIQVNPKYKENITSLVFVEEIKFAIKTFPQGRICDEVALWVKFKSVE